MSQILNYLLESINYVSLPSEVTKDSVKEFEQISETWADLDVQLHVLDFNHVNRLHVSFYPAAIKFRKRVEYGKRKMVSLNVKPNILEQMRAAGVVSALGYLKNSNLLKKTKTEDTSREVREWVAKYLIDSTRKTMETMFKTTLTADEKFSETMRSLHIERFPHIAMVTSQGPLVKAAIRLYFEEDILKKLTQTMPPDITPIDKATLDSTATELLNIVFNGAKSKLNDERGYQMPTGMPVTITAEQALNERLGNWRDTRVLPMKTIWGSYYLEIEFLT